MPGDNWNNSAKVYTQPAATNHIEEELTLDKNWTQEIISSQFPY